MGIMPVGTLLAGFMEESIGPKGAFVVMGAGMFVTTLLGLLDKTYRNATMLETKSAVVVVGSDSKVVMEAAS